LSDVAGLSYCPRFNTYTGVTRLFAVRLHSATRSRSPMSSGETFTTR
jgi:hypothetical protein